MPLRRLILTTMLLVGAAGWLVAGTPERSKGISIHMLPKRVADLGGDKWGLTVDHSAVVIQTPDEFLSYVRKQTPEVQENGVWIVTTHPDAYSDMEKALLQNIEDLCVKEKILLFVVRASELPNGWKRFGGD